MAFGSPPAPQGTAQEPSGMVKNLSAQPCLSPSPFQCFPCLGQDQVCNYPWAQERSRHLTQLCGVTGGGSMALRTRRSVVGSPMG